MPRPSEARFVAQKICRRLQIFVHRGLTGMVWDSWSTLQINGSWDAYLASPADFAGADDIITNLAKEREHGTSNALPNL